MNYRVTTIDVCMPGMERLRYNDEILLVVFGVNKDTTLGDIQEELKSEIDQLDEAGLPEGFDYGLATQVVLAEMEGRFSPDWLSDIEPQDDAEGPNLYVYLEVTN